MLSPPSSLIIITIMFQSRPASNVFCISKETEQEAIEVDYESIMSCVYLSRIWFWLESIMTCTFLDLKKSKVRRLAVRSAKEMGEWIFRCLLHHYGLMITSYTAMLCVLCGARPLRLFWRWSHGCNCTCYWNKILNVCKVLWEWFIHEDECPVSIRLCKQDTHTGNKIKHYSSACS